MRYRQRWVRPDDQPGFTRPEELQTFTIFIPNAQVKDAEAVARAQQAIRDRIAALPGVAAVAFGTAVPMAGQNSFDPIFVEDRPPAEGKLPPIRRFKFASPGFLPTLGNPLLAGRDFTWQDVYSMRPVAILTENLASVIWGSPSAAARALSSNSCKRRVASPDCCFSSSIRLRIQEPARSAVNALASS